MSFRTVYVRAASKKAINHELALGHRIWGTEYDMHGQSQVELGTLPHGTVIKVYSKVIDGSPYAKAYGQWNAKLGRVK